MTMKKNKITTIIFSLLIGILTIIPTFSHANCNEQEIISKLEESAKDGIKASLEALKSYNNVAERYKSQCMSEDASKKLENKSSYGWTGYALKQAIKIDSSLGTSLTNLSQFKNVGIVWGSETPKTAECRQLKNQASSLFKNYDKLRVSTVAALGFLDSETSIPKACVCPENSTTAECVSRTTTEEEPEETDDGCETFSTYLSKLSACPLCPVFEVILSTDAKIAHLSWNALAGKMQAIIGSIFLAYLALETLKNIGNMTGMGISSYLKSVLSLGFKVSIAYYLLDSSTYVYGYFISPVIKGGLDMGMAIANAGRPGIGQCVTGNADITSITSQELDSSLLNSILETVRCFGNTAATMPAVGRGLICHGWTIPDLQLDMWFAGLIIYLFGLMIWLCISFYLIDCTVQLGMVSALVPLLIACWPFKHTQSYSYKGVQLIMNTFFNYVMMGLVLLVGSEIVGAASGSDTSNAGMDAMVAAINENDLDKLEKLAEFDGVAILVLISCCIFAMKLIGTANHLAGKFATSSGSNIGSKMGGAAMSAATNVAKAGARVSGNTALGVAKAAYKDSDLEETVNTGKGAIQNAHQKVWSSAGKVVGLGRFQNKQQGMPIQDTDKNKQTQTPNEKDSEQKPQNPDTNNTDKNKLENKIQNAADDYENTEQGKADKQHMDNALKELETAEKTHGYKSSEAIEARKKLGNAISQHNKNKSKFIQKKINPKNLASVRKLNETIKKQQLSQRHQRFENLSKIQEKHNLVDRELRGENTSEIYKRELSDKDYMSLLGGEDIL